MYRAFFFFLALGFFAVSSASTWTLNRDVLEEKLPLGVTTEELIRILEKEGIEVCFEKPEDLTLWKKDRLSISLAKTPFSPYHLWIAIEGRKTLDVCTTEELTELYAALWKARKALSQVIGVQSFMLSFTEQRSSSVRVEMIAAGFEGTNGVMDAVEKNALNNYVFYKHLPHRKIFHDPKTLNALREKLQTLEPVVSTEVLQGRWSQKLLHHKEALHQNLQAIHDLLQEKGALIEGEMPPMPVAEEKVHEIQINLDQCAFCNPKVIEKQLVSEWKGVQILMSHKPISPYGNFLIVPKRHQCAWDLTKEEAISSFEAVIALKKMFAETVGSNDWVCYIQDGPAVGQTVPHAHIHFYLLPDPLKSAMTSLQHIHNQRPVLSHEEMRARCEKIRPSLLAELQGQDLQR